MPLKHNSFSSDKNRRPSNSSGYNAKGTDSRYKKSGSAFNADNARPKYEGLRDRQPESGGADSSRNEDRPFKKYGTSSDRRTTDTRTGAGTSFGRGQSDRKPFERKPFERKFSSKSDRDDTRGDSGGERKPFERKPFERKFSPRPDRDNSSRDSGGERKPFERNFSPRPDREDIRSDSGGERKPFERKFSPRPDRDDRSRDAGGERKPFERKFSPRPDRDDSRGDSDGERKPFERKFSPKTDRDNKRRIGPGVRKPTERKFGSGPGRDDSRRDTRPEGKPFERKYTLKPTGDEREDGEDANEKISFERKRSPKRESSTKERTSAIEIATNTEGAKMPLNKFVAHSGICSRREAAQLVKDGKVTVNNAVVTDPGYKVADNDVISYEGSKLNIQATQVYVLLNKPKDYITTTEDEKGRKTVMELVADCSEDRLFPVGRLDRNTTGLLLLTNDGTLAQRLTHPSFKIKKVYHVSLDKSLTEADFNKIVAGVTLEDGVANVDALAYLESRDELGIEIHSGKNRVIRRIFETLGYEVVKLDRVMYAGLTKKNVPRGKWRFLTPHEVVLLKHFKS